MTVEIPFGDSNSDNATLLLAAAEDLGLDPAVEVRTTTESFVVSQEVADKAGLGEKPKKAEKKSPAKKTSAKKK